MKYYWIRLFDYNFESDKNEKGTLLKEFYIKGDFLEKDEVKNDIKNEYEDIKFAKPRKKDGVYALVLPSDEFFYKRMYEVVEGTCFKCGCNIKGKKHSYREMRVENKNVIFCSDQCYRKVKHDLKYEGHFFYRGASEDPSLAGYIYEIYNRSNDTYYIGQSVHMPMYRWVEHMMSIDKGKITDLEFRVLETVNKRSGDSSYLNNVEAWWINDYISEGKKVFNVVNPRVTNMNLLKLYTEPITLIKNSVEKGR